MHAISSYRGNKLTKPQTNKQYRLQYTALLASAQCNKQPLIGGYINYRQLLRGLRPQQQGPSSVTSDFSNDPLKTMKYVMRYYLNMKRITHTMENVFWIYPG